MDKRFQQLFERAQQTALNLKFTFTTEEEILRGLRLAENCRTVASLTGLEAKEIRPIIEDLEFNEFEVLRQFLAVGKKSADKIILAMNRLESAKQTASGER